MEPVCVWGLTYTNLAEAACNGVPKKKISPKCYQTGVCTYAIRDGVQVTAFVTPPGLGGSVKAAAQNTNTPIRTDARYSYSEALRKSLLFFDSMVSGKFSNTNKRLVWRRDSCRECYDAKYGKDLSRGFYEAGGSYLKFPLINSYMATMLAWQGMEESAAMTKTGVISDLRWKVKWAADFLMDCHVADYVYVGLNGNDTLDFDYYGPPELYYKYVKNRPVGYITKTDPGSEVLADSAAALAAASILLKDKTDWSKMALEKAVYLYNWAREYPGSYMDNKDPVMKVRDVVARDMTRKINFNEPFLKSRIRNAAPF